MATGRTISTLTAGTPRTAGRIITITFTITETIKDSSNVFTTALFTGKVALFHILN